MSFGISLSWLTVSDIKSLASSGSYGRSSSLLGDVLSIEYEGSDTITAQVRGSSTYTVTIYLDGESVDSTECSCPDRRGGACKHVCAVLTHLIGSGRSSSPKRSASPKVSSGFVTVPAKAIPYTPVATPVVSVGADPRNQVFEELSSLANQYTQAPDVSLLAKIACVIYRNATDAVTMAKKNPDLALGIIEKLILFCKNRVHLFNQGHPQLNTSLETVATAASTVLLYNRTNVHQVSSLSNHLNQGCGSIHSARAKFLWKDAHEVASNCGASQPAIAGSNANLTYDTYL